MTKSKRSIIESATRPVRVVLAPEQLPTRTPNQIQTALPQINRADGWAARGWRLIDSCLPSRNDRPRINKPRKLRKARNRKRVCFGPVHLQVVAKKWLYAVSSQVMVWLVTNIAAEKPSRQSGRRELDVFSTPTERAVVS